MRLYLLKDASGTVIAAHPDRNIIRLHFFSSQRQLEIWIMDTSDATGVVESYHVFLTKVEGVCETT
jgi:hypothetical protein